MQPRTTTLQLNSKLPFNLDFTLCCGQTFRWKKQGEWWYGIVAQEWFKIRQDSEKLEFQGSNEEFVWNYFRLDDDLPNVLSNINKDKTIQTAITRFKGLRILRQEPWECLVSYICATYKTISAIKHMLANLSRMFGEEIRLDDQNFHIFPKPARLAKAEMQQLIACGLGYRAKYVQETAKMICEGALDLERLKKASYEKSKQELMNLPGVGPKVADCALLFSLEKLEAFPVDVWIKRTILNHYSEHLPKEFVDRVLTRESLDSSTYQKLNSFGREYFGPYAGYAQEYLYHYERTSH